MLPKRLDRKTIYQSSWITLHSDKVQMPSGEIVEKYHIYEAKPGVVVVLENEKKEICMIKSLRYATQRIEWELPAGGVEEDESILSAAKREALEETGYKAKNLKHIHSFNPHNGMSDYVVHVVKGQIDKDSAQEEFDEDEVSEVHWLSKEKIDELIASNEIMDGCTLMGILISEKT